MSRLFRPPLIILTLVLICEIVLIFQFSTKIYTVLQRQEKLDELRKQRDTAEQIAYEKQVQLRYVKSDLYVEDIARGSLGYTMEGERVYMVDSQRLPELHLPAVSISTTNTETDYRPWWQENALSWWSLFF